MDNKVKVVEIDQVKLPVDDAILILREEHRQRSDGYTEHLAHGGKGDPTEEVNLDALAMAISALEQTKWISVKDRLPEDGVLVLCIGPRGGMFLGRSPSLFSDGTCYFEVPNARSCRYGTHWMPLPEPPKGE